MSELKIIKYHYIFISQLTNNTKKKETEKIYKTKCGTYNYLQSHECADVSTYFQVIISAN